MIWLLALSAPLVAACALGFERTREAATRVLVPLGAAPALALALFADAASSVHLPWLLLGTHFGFGESSRVMLAFTALLWLAAGIYAGSYLAHDPRRTRFFVFFAFAMCGNLGLAAAQDLASFYLYFALMTFSAYGLVVHNGSDEAYRAGRIYLVVAIFGEVLLLAALLLTAGEMRGLLLVQARAAVAASESRDLIVLLAFVGFGVKAGAALVHFWLPLAHPVAPVPASAVLSGTMIKAGLIGWLHFLPFGEGGFPAWGAVLVAAGYVAAFGGALLGLAQRDPKTVLAYSSVSQMGLITAVLGTGLADASLWPVTAPVVAVLALNHALAKGALFLGVGVVQHAGAFRALALGGLALAALAIAGAPWTGGAIAKHAAKGSLAGLETAYAGTLPLLMALSSAVTALLLTRFLTLVARDPSRAHFCAGLFAPWAVLVVCTAAGVPAALAWFAIEIDTGQPDAWSALLPVAFGVAAYPALKRVLHGRRIEIPAGDIVVALERWARALGRAAARAPVPGPAQWQIDFVHYFEELAATEARRDVSRRIELRLARWSNAGLAFAGVAIALAVLVLV